MVLGGRVNKSLVSLIQQAGGQAVGLSGKDGGVLRARQVGRKAVQSSTCLSVCLAGSGRSTGWDRLGSMGWQLSVRMSGATCHVALQGAACMPVPICLSGC
jgi:hypothetical protein